MVKCMFSLAIKYHWVFIAMCYCSGLVWSHNMPRARVWLSETLVMMSGALSPLVWASESSEMWRHRVTAGPDHPRLPQSKKHRAMSAATRPGRAHGALCLQITAPYKLSAELARREPIRPRSGGLDQREASIQVTWPLSTNQGRRVDGEWTNQRPKRGIIERGAEAPSPRWHGVYICKRDDVL